MTAPTHAAFPVAVLVMLWDADRLLMSLRAGTGYADGCWSLVAGHLDGRETVAEAAAREVREEVGIQIAPSDITVLGVLHRLSDVERIEFIVSGHNWTGTPRNMEPQKCGQISWHDPNGLPENTLDYVRRAVQLCRRRTTPREGIWFTEPDFSNDNLGGFSGE